MIHVLQRVHSINMIYLKFLSMLNPIDMTFGADELVLLMILIPKIGFDMKSIIFSSYFNKMLDFYPDL